MSRGRAVASLQNMRRDLKRMDDALMEHNYDLSDSLALTAQAWALSFIAEDEARLSTGSEESYDELSAAKAERDA